MDVVPGRHLQAIDEASTGIAAARALARDCDLGRWRDMPGSRTIGGLPSSRR
jgi:hypothetical protein